MNILQLQDNLKNLSDQQILQEMRMPTGQVPGYLLLSEMQRRKQMRSDASVGQMPHTTVADDLVRSATPVPGGMNGGIGALGGGSPPNAASMPPTSQPQGYADGGAVSDYAQSQADSMGIPLWEYQSRGLPMQDPNRTMPIGADGSGSFIQFGTPDYSHLGNPDAPMTGPSMTDHFLDWYSNHSRYQTQAAQEAAKQQSAPAEPQMQSIPNPNIPAPQMGIGGLMQKIAATHGGGGHAGPQSNPAAAVVDKTRTLQNQMGSSAGADGPLASEMQQIKSMMPDRFSGVADALKGITGDPAEEKDQLQTEALMALGFGMASGRSPYFAENFGAGGQQALQVYSDLDKERRQAAAQKAEISSRIAEAQQTGDTAALNAALSDLRAKQQLDYENRSLDIEAYKAKNPADIQFAKWVTDPTNPQAVAYQTFQLEQKNLGRRDAIVERMISSPEINQEAMMDWATSHPKGTPMPSDYVSTYAMNKARQAYPGFLGGAGTQATPAVGAGNYNSLAELKAAVANGTIQRDAAIQIARSRGWAR